MPCEPFREPVRITLVRNGTIAVIAGALVARFWGGLASWPLATLLALWPSLGGHWLEVGFLNGLRPRIAAKRNVQVLTRLAIWFGGGIVLAWGMRLTAMALSGSRTVRWPASWLAGLAFIGIELAVHLVLQLRGRPSFYNGRG